MHALSCNIPHWSWCRWIQRFLLQSPIDEGRKVLVVSGTERNWFTHSACLVFLACSRFLNDLCRCSFCGAFHSVQPGSHRHGCLPLQVQNMVGSLSGQMLLCQHLCYPLLLLQCARLHQVSLPCIRSDGGTSTSAFTTPSPHQFGHLVLVDAFVHCPCCQLHCQQGMMALPGLGPGFLKLLQVLNLAAVS